LIIPQKKKGFIFITIIVIVGFTYFIYNKIISTAMLHYVFTRNMTLEAQSKLLIFAGCSAAMLKLLSFEDGVLVKAETEDSMPGISRKETRVTNTITHDDRLKTLYFGLLSNLNSWQKIILNYELDGIDAKIYYCLSCEEGKFGLNNIFDLKKKEFQIHYKTIFDKFKLKNIKKKEDSLAKIFSEELSLRKEWFNDPTEILPNEKAIWYYYPPKKHSAPDVTIIKKELESALSKQPETQPALSKPEQEQLDKTSAGKKNQKENASPMGDLFSIVSPDNLINPFLLSPSVMNLLGITEDKIQRQSPRFKKVLNKVVEKISYQFKFEDSLSSISSLFGKKIKGVDPLSATDLVDADSALVTSDPQTTEVKPVEENKKDEDLLITLKNVFTKKIEPEFFSLLIETEYNGLNKRAIIIFKRKTIVEKYEPQYQQKESTSKTNTNFDKNSSKNKETSKPDIKKNVSLEKASYFIPDGFEIIRFYWL
jgi:hypothetical protein